MQVSTKAIVLTAIKYGDSSLIVRCYTEQSGSKSYLLRGVLKSKKGKLRPAYFQPLMCNSKRIKLALANTLAFNHC